MPIETFNKSFDTTRISNNMVLNLPAHRQVKKNYGELKFVLKIGGLGPD